MDVDQLDIHQSANTFIQGDFTFAHTESGTAVEYYEKYGKKYEEAGKLSPYQLKRLKSFIARKKK